MSITAIKTQTDILEVANKLGIEIDPKSNKALCPFHNDKNPSLQFSKEKQIATCFSGNCSAGTMDVITLVEKKLGVNNIEALKYLNPISPSQPSPKGRATLLERLEKSSKHAFNTSKQSKAYADFRGLKDELYYLGPEFYRNWSENDKEEGEKIGLLKKYRLSLYSSAFKSRLVFFLRDKNGVPVSIYGRAIENSNSVPHLYLKNSQTGLFPSYPKPQTKQLILTESIIDASSLLQEVSPFGGDLEGASVLACYGTNGLTKEHTEAIKNLTGLKEIILWFDGDEAGNKAIQKYIITFQKLLPNIKLSKVETPEGEDINSLMVGHEQAGELFSHLVTTRSPLLIPPKGEGLGEAKQSPVLNNEQKSTLRGDSGGLITTNEQYITYQKGALKFTLLGGINLQQADRLKVTLKINVEPQLNPLHSIRHSFDLYNDDAVEKFARKAAVKLEVGTTELHQSINELTEKLEAYRQSKIESYKEKKPVIRLLTEPRIKAAKAYLQGENLLTRTGEDIGKTGVVGEEENRLLMYLIFTSRLREEPLHVISLGASGTGKTYLQEKVAELIPEEHKLEITMLSENAFYYFGKQELQHKLVLIEDMDGAENVLYPLRELMSKKRISKTIPIKDSKGNLRTITMQVEGPICVAGTTTKEKVYEDNANRSILLYRDNSLKHQESIMDYQRRASAGIINPKQEDEIKELFKDMQCLLKPISVRNPYATKLKIPAEVFKPLRTNSHYLQFIECITFYHQYQREIKQDKYTGEQYIETNLEDIKAANELLKEVLLSKADELSGECRKFLERLKNHLENNNQKAFYAKDIRHDFRMNPNNLKYYVNQLVKYGYVKVAGGSRYTGLEYEIVNTKEYNTLKNNIKTALDLAVKNLGK